MHAQDIFDIAIAIGKKNDLRPLTQVEKKLTREEKAYKKLKKEEKQYFDEQRLTNPYLDTYIHNISKKNVPVKRVMVGIDIDASELLIAQELSQNDPKNPIDLVIAHHPVGQALIGLDDVMDMQVEVLAQYGVPINIAEGLLHKRISEISRGLNPINHFKPVTAAKNLDMSFMNVHTPADNCVATFLKNLVESKEYEYVGDILETVMTVPEYQTAKKQGVGPCLFAGKEKNRAGKIAITEVTGGTEGSPDIYSHLAAAGIGTVVAMHQSEKHREAAEKAHINVINVGHMSSDSIGMNLFLDALEKKGVEIVPCSGLIRHSRVK